MDEKNYRALCQVCDEILLEAPDCLEFLAIAWLHVIREHPAFLHRYERLFADSVIEKRLQWLGFKRSMVEVLRVIRQLVRALRNTFSSQESLLSSLGSVDVIFISHLLNSRQRDGGDDFYFGSLPADLAANGKQVAIVLIDHTRASSVCMSLLPSSTDGVTRLVLANTIGLGAELGLLKRMWKISKRMLKRVGGGTLHARARVAAAAEALSNASLHSYRIAFQASALIAQMRPQTLITTFEGHAWERLTYALARQRMPGIRCAGYMHAVLFRLQHGVRRNLKRLSDPDVVFTSGPAGRRQLDGIDKEAGPQVRVLGSVRAGISTTWLDHSARSQRLQTPVCLVLPEGLESETLMLFGYALQCARSLPKVTFLWRLHPVISFEDMVKRNPDLRCLPPNVELSKGALEEDAERACWTLYRGSTAIISAVSFGSTPVYLSVAGEMTIDPLFELGGERAIVATVQDMVSLVQGGDRGYPTDEQMRRLVLHCMEIFSPLSAEVLIEYVGSRDGRTQVKHAGS